MFNNFVAALMGDNDLVYVLYVFRGHLFRKYPDGHLGRADTADAAFYNWRCKK